MTLRAISGLMHCSKNGSLFDQLVSELLELQRHLEAQRLGGLEIDDQLELCRRLQWKVGRLLTLEDAVEQDRRALTANVSG